MKKLFLVLLALCLFVVPALAQTEDDPVVTNWEDLEEDFIATGYSGKFYTFADLGIQFLVPGGLEPLELSEENLEKGFAGIFLSEDESIMLAVSMRDLECETLTEVAELAVSSSDKIKFGGYYKINGFDAIMFYNEETDQMTCAIPTTADGYFIQVSLNPMTNEEINKLSGFIFGSIQPFEE